MGWGCLFLPRSPGSPQACSLKSVLFPTHCRNWDFLPGTVAQQPTGISVLRHSCFVKGSGLACVPPEADLETRILIQIIY